MPTKPESRNVKVNIISNDLDAVRYFGTLIEKRCQTLFSGPTERVLQEGVTIVVSTVFDGVFKKLGKWQSGHTWAFALEPQITGLSVTFRHPLADLFDELRTAYGKNVIVVHKSDFIRASLRKADDRLARDRDEAILHHELLHLVGFRDGQPEMKAADHTYIDGMGGRGVWPAGFADMLHSSAESAHRGR